MRRGFKEPDYNLNVKIPHMYEEDDIYALASLYNEIYLPLKDINQSVDKPVNTDINLADYKDLLKLWGTFDRNNGTSDFSDTLFHLIKGQKAYCEIYERKNSHSF